jgi:hypothetical protein
VQSHTNTRMSREMLQERQIRLLINFFQDRVKIPNRLMRMNDEDEVDSIQGWTLRKREA